MLKKFSEEKKKQYIALGVAVVVLGGGVLLLSYLFTRDNQQKQPPAPPPKIETPAPRKIEEEAFKKEYGERLLELQKRVEQLERRESLSAPPVAPPPPPPTSAPASPIPPPPPPAEGAPPAPPGTVNQAQAKPQVLSDLIAFEGERQKPQTPPEGQPKKEDRQTAQRKTGSIIPAGSFVRGILLSGLDAPTGGRAQSQPHPVLIRITDRAVLPNLYKADIRDCFVIGAGYGDLSSERAYIRLEALSCVKKNGEVIERRVQGFVSGEDGKVGLVGRVVSKQGQVLARMLLAGFIDGISRVFQQSGTTVIVGPAGATQTIDPSQALRVGLSGGIATAARELVEFYKKLAEETYPVVEINAGRNVDLVFLQSIDFSSESKQVQGIREEEQGILRTKSQEE